MHLFSLLPQGFTWLFLLVIVLVSREVWLPCLRVAVRHGQSCQKWNLNTHTHALSLTYTHTCAHANSPYYSFLSYAAPMPDCLSYPHPHVTHIYSLHSRPHNYTQHTRKHAHTQAHIYTMHPNCLVITLLFAIFVFRSARVFT